MLTGITSRLDPDSVWSNFNSVGMVERSRRRSASGPSAHRMQKQRLKLVILLSLASMMILKNSLIAFAVIGELKTHYIGY